MRLVKFSNLTFCLFFSQVEARRAFSNYLQCVLQRLTGRADNPKSQQTDLVLRFLQRASAQLRTSYVVKLPNHKLSEKDKNAIVARHLCDFLTLYNRETDLFATSTDRPNHIPNKMFQDFLHVARFVLIKLLLLLYMNSPFWITKLVTDLLFC